MAGFRLQKPYSMPKEEVREAAEGLAKKLQREHGVRYRWQGDTVSIRGSGIGNFKLRDDFPRTIGARALKHGSIT